MLKKIFLSTFILPVSLYSQDLVVDADCVDTLSGSQFLVELNGQLVMGDSVDLEIDLLFNDSTQLVYQSYAIDFSNQSNSNLIAFEVLGGGSGFRAQVCVIPSLNYWVRVRRKVHNEVHEELMVPIFMTF